MATQGSPFFSAKVPTRVAWADRKDAKSGIPAGSARAIPGAGRFALLPMPRAFYD